MTQLATYPRLRSRHAPPPLPESRPVMLRRYRVEWEEWSVDTGRRLLRLYKASGLTLLGLARLGRELLRRKVSRFAVEVAREF